MSLQRILSMQQHRDGREGHLEREAIRAAIDYESHNHIAMPQVRKSFVAEPLDLTVAPIIIDDIRQCPAFIRGCTLANCRKCKQRVWAMECAIRRGV